MSCEEHGSRHGAKRRQGLTPYATSASRSHLGRRSSSRGRGCLRLVFTFPATCRRVPIGIGPIYPSKLLLPLNGSLREPAASCRVLSAVVHPGLPVGPWAWSRGMQASAPATAYWRARLRRYQQAPTGGCQTKMPPPSRAGRRGAMPYGTVRPPRQPPFRPDPVSLPARRRNAAQRGAQDGSATALRSASRVTNRTLTASNVSTGSRSPRPSTSSSCRTSHTNRSSGRILAISA